MNGIHDMGGMQDMGPVRPEQSEPVFHAEWEARLFAIELALDGGWNVPAGRFQIELIPAADYLRMSYYEKWLASRTTLMLKAGLVTEAELETGKVTPGSGTARRLLKPDEVASVLRAGTPSSSDAAVAPKFGPGQHVRARNINPEGHTRLPRYARGKLGTIARDHGVFVFPDRIGNGLDDKPQHVYAVRFAARELWGEHASPVDAVYVDLWDDHLEPV